MNKNKRMVVLLFPLFLQCHPVCLATGAAADATTIEPQCSVVAEAPRHNSKVSLPAGASDLAGVKTDAAEIADLTRCEFHIPPVSLAEALKLYSRQAAVGGMRVRHWLTLDARSKPFTTKSLTGVYGVAEALQILLAGSQLTARFVQPYDVIVDAEAALPPRKAIPLGPSVIVANKKIPEISVEGKRDGADNIVDASSDGIQPLATIDGRELERFGGNVESAIALRLPANVARLNGGQPNTVDMGRSPFNLRGLGSDETLTLVDGRRIGLLWSGGTRGQGDVLGAIPTAAVERIEIYPSTISNRYGGGATAGVVNIILRHDCSSARFAASYGDTIKTDSPNRGLFLSDCLLAFNDQTRISFSASEAKEASLQSQSRYLLTRGRESILYNNEPFFSRSPIPPVGAQTNVFFVGESGSTGIKAGSHLTVPKGYTQAQGLGPLLDNLGHYNLDQADSAQDGGGASVIRNGALTRHVSAQILQQFSDRLTGHADFNLYEIRVQNPTNIAPYTGLTGLYIPADAPGNPFRQAVYVSVPAVGGDGELETRADSKQLIVGLDFQPLGSWTGGLEYTRSQRVQEWNLTVGRSAADAVRSGQLDVFRDLSTESLALDSFKDTLFAPGLVSTTDALSLQAAGTVMRWRFGAVTMRGLLEHRRERFEGGMQYLRTGSADATPMKPLTPQARNIDSAYVEIRAPMGGSTTVLSSKAPRFELQIAGRFDEYMTDVAPAPFDAGFTTPIEPQPSRFRTFNPTAGFQYRPFPRLTLRGSFGKGFVPPSGDQLALPVPHRFPQGAFRDPKRGNEPTDAVDLQAGGNPALEPEHSRSWSAGLLVQSPRARGLQASLDYVVITKTNDIVNPADLLLPDFSLFAQLYPDRVARAPAAADDPFGVGPITAIDASYINIARSRIRAWDLSARWGTEPNRFGELDLLGHVTWQPEFSSRAAPGAPIENNVAVTANAPVRLGAVSEASFTRGHGKLSWVTRYFGPYWVSRDSTTIQNQGGRKVAHQTYHDLAFTYDLPESAFFSSDELQLNFTVQNVLDQEPPFDAGSLNYFSPFGDPRGAVYGMSFSVRF